MFKGNMLWPQGKVVLEGLGGHPVATYNLRSELSILKKNMEQCC